MEQALYKTWQEALPHLQVGDFVLVRYNESTLFWRGAIGYYIRKAIGSHWNHLGLVFETPDVDPKGRDALIIEGLHKGMEVHRVMRYFEKPGQFDVGIKRFPGLTEAQRERMRGFFLDVLDTPYDYTRLFAFFFRRLFKSVFGVKVTEYIKHRVINIDQFICSSFAQRALYLALPPNERDRAFFRDDKSLTFLDQLEEITPADIAGSKNTEWLYNPHP
jgi:hypothetical protein